jgi:hypothetical protein
MTGPGTVHGSPQTPPGTGSTGAAQPPLEGAHNAETVRKRTRCELVHQMHRYDLFTFTTLGYWIERCVNCGLTKAEIAARNDGGRDELA